MKIFQKPLQADAEAKGEYAMIRPAVSTDLDTLEGIYRSAREFMHRSGNPSQWTGNYPSREILLEDIASGALCAVTDGKSVHGAFVLKPGPDPTYTVIDGAWQSDAPYAAIHRVAGDGLTRGVFHECVEYAKARWASLRIDTHRDNLPMQRHILREGFVYCGVIRTRDGTERLAYQWDAPCRREKQA